jgi:uncharacterized membrane protein
MTGNLISWIKTRMLAGIIVLTPLVITIWIFHTLFVQLDGILSVLTKRLVGRHIPGTGLVALILLTLFVGALAGNLFGKKLLTLGNLFLGRIPVASRIYNAIQQMTHVFIGEKKGVFQKVVLVEFPRKGLYRLGFVTSMDSGEAVERAQGKLVNVFIPSTPNPTGGFLVFLPEEEIVPLEMSVEDGLKMVVSGGAYVPLNPPARSAPQEVRP